MPCDSEGSAWRCPTLELEPHRPLDDARRDTAATSRVERRCQLAERGRISGCLRTGEVDVVEHVESFQTDLELQTLKNLRIFDHRKILIEEVRQRQSIEGQIAEPTDRRRRRKARCGFRDLTGC